ncbi:MULTISPECIES: CpsD/CapB family tyrosine-protein kinase [unclassified Pseudofrankia]|uniref:CpsD/CapB family tyrosine-protein kinase n=1 Tax=unclassified Pseudofrankia TaxID=2994372 RepID=UPI0012FFB9FF|nr:MULTISPECIES: CpsD/CapB family tyrosine-protein kinase [unclassified Pseudofrankia]MDT3438808.1 CpsD/CapB family tyrosine-protein kinase [Pseudofrankia sp. BMG5.37]
MGGLLSAAAVWRPVRVVAFGVLIGLVAGGAVALGRRLRDIPRDRARAGERDVVRITGAPVLGSVAHEPDAARRPLVVYGSPRSPRAEAFRRLRATLPFLHVDGPPRAVVVTSAVAAEGRSTTCCNLAITAAYGGARVCLVEADLCQPSFAGYLGVESSPGLTSVLIGAAELDAAARPWGAGRVGDGWLDVLPSGPIPPNPSGLLASRGMADLLERLTSRYDLVVVDAPPLLSEAGAAVLASRAGGALLVARAGHTRGAQLRGATAALAAAGGQVLGTVLTMVPAAGPAGVGASRRLGLSRGDAAGRRRWPHVALPARPVRPAADPSSRGEPATALAGRPAGAARAGDEPVSLTAIAEQRAAVPDQLVPDRLAPAVDA